MRNSSFFLSWWVGMFGMDSSLELSVLESQFLLDLEIAQHKFLILLSDLVLSFIKCSGFLLLELEQVARVFLTPSQHICFSYPCPQISHSFQHLKSCLPALRDHLCSREYSKSSLLLVLTISAVCHSFKENLRWDVCIREIVTEYALKCIWNACVQKLMQW